MIKLFTKSDHHCYTDACGRASLSLSDSSGIGRTSSCTTSLVLTSALVRQGVVGDDEIGALLFSSCMLHRLIMRSPTRVLYQDVPRSWAPGLSSCSNLVSLNGSASSSSPGSIVLTANDMCVVAPVWRPAGGGSGAAAFFMFICRHVHTSVHSVRRQAHGISRIGANVKERLTRRRQPKIERAAKLRLEWKQKETSQGQRRKRSCRSFEHLPHERREQLVGLRSKKEVKYVRTTQTQA